MLYPLISESISLSTYKVKSEEGYKHLMDVNTENCQVSQRKLCDIRIETS